MASFAVAGSPMRREVPQPLASSSLVSPGTASPEKNKLVLKDESE